MSNLAEYVFTHTNRNACRCGQCVVSGEDRPMSEHTVDMCFFDVCAKDNPDAEELKHLIAAHQGVFQDVNVFDGEEHNYIELGGWLGDQGLALQFMGLGAILGLWQLLTPITVAGFPKGHPLVNELAKAGLLTIKAKE